MLGGMYALIAMGLTLQYGVARIMNLSYGEFLVAAAFASFWLFTGMGTEPAARAGRSSFPSASCVNWADLSGPADAAGAPRAERASMLEVDSILATFGMLFIVQGIMLDVFGGAYYSYSYLSIPVSVFGETAGAEPADRVRPCALVHRAGALSRADAHARPARRSAPSRSIRSPRGWSPSTSPRLGFRLCAGRRAGGRGRRAGQHVPHLQRVDRASSSP